MVETDCSLSRATGHEGHQDHVIIWMWEPISKVWYRDTHNNYVQFGMRDGLRWGMLTIPAGTVQVHTPKAHRIECIVYDGIISMNQFPRLPQRLYRGVRVEISADVVLFNPTVYDSSLVYIVSDEKHTEDLWLTWERFRVDDLQRLCKELGKLPHPSPVAKRMHELVEEHLSHEKIRMTDNVLNEILFETQKRKGTSNEDGIVDFDAPIDELEITDGNSSVCLGDAECEEMMRRECQLFNGVRWHALLNVISEHNEDIPPSC